MDAIVYSLKVSVFLIAFYLMFKSLMSRETLHRANRYLILGSIGLSFALPLWHITLNSTSSAAGGHTIAQSVVMLQEVIVGGGAPSQTFDWRVLAVAVFYTGIGICLLRMIISIMGVLRIIRRGERQTLPDGTVLVITDDEQAPFSWIKYIIINRKDHDENLQEILTHEQAHIRCRHSIDVLVCDVLCCLQWFNPAMWLLRRELCAVHEYEADKAVLDSGINAKQYQILLIKKAAGGKWYSIANSFNHSKLKYRITMMSRKKSSGWTMAKALYVLPIAAFAAIAFANCSKTEGEITKNPDLQNLEKMPADQYNQILELMGGEVKEDMLVFNYEDATGEMTVTSMSPDGTVRPVSDEELEKMRVPDDIVVEELIEESEKDFDNDQVFMLVEEMPEFPGGDLELRKFIAENVKYPAEAKEKKIKGKVFVQFVINKDGNVEDVKLARGVDPLLDEAAMDVVKSLPQWKPGRQRGQNVKVSFTVPINFQLD
jgi:TonB family protein